MKYKPYWCETPFQHLKYTLVRNQKQLNRVYGDKSQKFMSTGYDAQVNLIDGFAIVQLGCTKERSLIEIHGLILHEAVHIWQELKLKMNESEPSIEFEAYSIQVIAQDLFKMYEDSEK